MRYFILRFIQTPTNQRHTLTQAQTFQMDSDDDACSEQLYQSLNSWAAVIAVLSTQCSTFHNSFNVDRTLVTGQRFANEV